MNIEIKISKKRISYKKAMLFLNKRVDDVKNGKKRELLWILEHPTTYTAGVSFNQKEILDKKIKKGSSEYKNFLQFQREKLSIQRFKGLGEMNPEELWETTLNPENRTILKVQYTKGTKDKSREDQKMIKILMGDEVAPRKDFITNNALDVVNLDI